MTTSLRWRHLTLSLLVLILTALAASGWIGPAAGRERITSYDVTATIREDRTVAVREVIDWDFGSAARRGIFRTIPADGGQPIEIGVSAPIAPDQFTVQPEGTDTLIRIGDPNTTNRGRYRYEITYILPATIVDGRFVLDAVGTEFDVPIDHAQVTVIGAQLGDSRCFTGTVGSRDRCEIVDDDGIYRVAVDNLPTSEGLTIDGDVVTVLPAALPTAPPFEGRTGHPRLTWAGIIGALATSIAAGVFLFCRQRGRNQVAAGGATEAAFAADFESINASTSFGAAAVDPAPESASQPDVSVTMVADQQMAALAGIEFAPPRGVEPWQGATVLREVIDDRTVGAWFAGLAAQDIVTMSRSEGKVVLGRGRRFGSADAVTVSIIDSAFTGRKIITLGRYDANFAAAWARAATAIESWAETSGVFRRLPPRYRQKRRAPWLRPLIVGGSLFPFVGIPLLTTMSRGFLRTGPAAIILTIAVMGPAAWRAYRPLNRSLGFVGSAMALRTESFRRFLHTSEGHHVEWAWTHGLLREYSAWAVALDEAQAWNAAMSTSSIAPAERLSAIEVMSPSLFDSTFLTTSGGDQLGSGSSSGSSSDSGSSSSSFSDSGSVGGGGGGGGGGSW